MTGRRAYGTWAPVNASRSSADTTMKFLTLASTAQATNLRRQVPMEWLASTTYSLAPARLFYKATRMKSVKSRLTRKETRSSRRVATRRAVSGPLIPVMKSSAWVQTREKVTKMKYSRACSTTKAIRLSLDQRITPAAFGKM